MPPIARLLGLDRAVRTHARHGPHSCAGLNLFTFLLGGSDGERIFGP
jgi:hypothetical protein